MSSPMIEKVVTRKRLTLDAIQERTDAVIRSRPIKQTSRITGFSEAAVKKWRLFGLPAAMLRGIQLLLADDEIYSAVLELASRNPPPTLSVEQRRAAEEVLRILSGGK